MFHIFLTMKRCGATSTGTSLSDLLLVEEALLWKTSLPSLSLSLSHVFKVFEFQGWNSFLSIIEDIYTGLVPSFYSTLVSMDEDNTSSRNIIGSFEIQVLPSDIAQITNTPNKGFLCKGGAK